MGIIGTITALFRLDTREAETSAKRVSGVLNKELTSSLQNMSGSAGVAGKALAALGPAGLAVAGTVGAVAAAVTFAAKELVSMGDKFTNLSRQFRIGTDELQRLEAGGRGLGISLESLANESRKLEKNLGGHGSGTVKAMEDLGLSYSKLAAMPADQRLIAVHQALAQIQDPLKQSALGAELLGKGFQVMSQTDLAEFTREAQDAVIVSQDALKAGDALGDSWEKLKANSKALAAEGVAPLVGWLAQVSDNLNFAITRWEKFKDESNRSVGTVNAVAGAAGLGAATAGGARTMEEKAATDAAELQRTASARASQALA